MSVFRIALESWFNLRGVGSCTIFLLEVNSVLFNSGRYHVTLCRRKHNDPMLTYCSETAQVLSELETIVDLNSRLDLMSKVPHETFSATCIGCGLELAAKVRLVR